jgi:hypothetical protein
MRSPGPSSFIATAKFAAPSKTRGYRPSGLNLAVAAVILWNIVYLGGAVAELRTQGDAVPDERLSHVAPLGWEHVAFNGDNIWPPAPGKDSFRPLRNPRSSCIDAP